MRSKLVIMVCCAMVTKKAKVDLDTPSLGVVDLGIRDSSMNQKNDRAKSGVFRLR